MAGVPIYAGMIARGYTAGQAAATVGVYEVASSMAMTPAIKYGYNKMWKGTQRHYESGPYIAAPRRKPPLDSYNRAPRYKKSIPNQMSYNYRRDTMKRPAPQPTFTKVPRPMPRRRVGASGFRNDNFSKFVVLKRERAIGLSSSAGTSNEVFSVADLSGCPQLPFIKELYLKYKLAWIKVEIHDQFNLHVIYSACTYEDNTKPTDADSVLKHFNSRSHDCTSAKTYEPSRTLKLTQSQQFMDWENTSGIDSQLGTSTQTTAYNHTVVDGSKKACIKMHMQGALGGTLRATVSFGLLVKTVDENLAA